jgi:hypothetical protein
MSEKQQKQILVALAILLPVIFWMQFGKSGKGRSRTRASHSRKVESSLDGKQLVDLRLSSLDAPPGSYEPNRNLFIFAPDPPPPPPPPPPPIVRREVARIAPPPPREPLEPQPPDVDLNLIGIFGPERHRIAVFTDGETVINAVLDEVINEKFIVDRIGWESVDLKFVGFPKSEAETLELGT